jgi:uncharacterized protein with HEPN domain
MNVGRRKPSEYIQDMLDICRKVGRYTAGMTEAEFFTNTLVQDAVIRNLEVLGEAAKQLLDVCPDAQARFPSIPFGEMYVTRNRLIHGYSSIRLMMLWEVASRDIPPVQASLEATIAAWPHDIT